MHSSLSSHSTDMPKHELSLKMTYHLNPHFSDLKCVSSILCLHILQQECFRNTARQPVVLLLFASCTLPFLLFLRFCKDEHYFLNLLVSFAVGLTESHTWISVQTHFNYQPGGYHELFVLFTTNLFLAHLRWSFVYFEILMLIFYIGCGSSCGKHAFETTHTCKLFENQVFHKFYDLQPCSFFSLSVQLIHNPLLSINPIPLSRWHIPCSLTCFHTPHHTSPISLGRKHILSLVIGPYLYKSYSTFSDNNVCHNLVTWTKISQIKTSAMNLHKNHFKLTANLMKISPVLKFWISTWEFILLTTGPTAYLKRSQL